MTLVRWIALAVLGAGGLFVAFGLFDAWKPMGARPGTDRTSRYEKLAHWVDGKFQDVLPRIEPPLTPIIIAMAKDQTPQRSPSPPLDVGLRPTFSDTPPQDLRVTWFGHSSFMIELNGTRLLVDPVWGPRASPLTWMGSKRYYEPLMPLEELPPVDAVLISHDHYDHLDYPTMLTLAQRVPRFLVPLGIGAHLEYWGIDPSRIVELDWWGEHTIGNVKLVSTPARHFSGRSFPGRDNSLWTGWAMLGQSQRVYYTGDTGMFPGFTEIGERLGPFDLTLVESGAYNGLWPDVHLGPEQAVDAHRMVQGKAMMAVHWGLFDLAMHSWTEPIERVRAAAKPHGIPLAIPKPGESFTLNALPSTQWWPDVPWKTASETPIVSSGL